MKFLILAAVAALAMCGCGETACGLTARVNTPVVTATTPAYVAPSITYRTQLEK